MYRYKEELNSNNFFKFRKSFVRSKLWRQLPLSTKSIYPVIACHMNKKGKAFPSQETIGILSGCSLKTVREGTKGLFKMPCCNISSKVNKRGQRGKLYRFEMPENNEYFFSFYKAVIEYGQWRILRKDFKSHAAHAVYCTLMAFSFFEIDLYNELEGTEYYSDSINNFYENEFSYRHYDFVAPELSVVAEYSGIGESTAEKACQALLNVKLLKAVPEEVNIYDTQVWQIFRIPTVFYARDYLNDSLPTYQPENNFINPNSDLIDKDIIMAQIKKTSHQKEVKKIVTH